MLNLAKVCTKGTRVLFCDLCQKMLFFASLNIYQGYLPVVWLCKPEINQPKGFFFFYCKISPFTNSLFQFVHNYATPSFTIKDKNEFLSKQSFLIMSVFKKKTINVLKSEKKRERAFHKNATW